MKESDKNKFQSTFDFYSMEKSIEYEKIEIGQTVFKIGDKAEKLYIIISGNLYLFESIETTTELSISGI